jgi:mRNA-degrading endonuclease RelE of RelBE toxin-antitoxin system
LKPKYTVVLTRQAEHFYKKLEPKEKAQVREALICLEESGFLGKRLHGDLKGKNSLRVGKVRIVYSISVKDKIVYVVAIGQRRNVYG